MRGSIITWSVASGLVMGMLVDTALFGAVLAMLLMVPGLSARLDQRWIVASTVAILIAVPVALAVLGYLEGRLKAA